MSNVENIRFNVLRNALYHTARRRKFERRSRWLNFGVIVAGASAMSGVLDILGVSQLAAAAAATLFGTIQLVFDPAGGARDHQALQRGYYGLLADIEAVIDPSDEQCAGWYSKMVRISGDETPTMRAVDAKAYNDAVDAMEMDESLRLHIPLWQRPFQHFIAFEGYRYRKLGELAQAGTIVNAEGA